MKKYLGITIFFLAAILVLKMFLSHHFASSTAGVHGLLKEKKSDYIFIGSSQTRQDLNPFILQDSLRSTYNVSYSSLSLPLIGFITDRIIESKIGVKTIIIEINLNKVIENPGIVDTRLFQDIDFNSKMKLLKICKPWMSTWDMYYVIMLSGNENILTSPFTMGFINSLSYRGGYKDKIVPGLTPAQFATLKPKYPEKTPFSNINPIYIETLKNIANSLTKHNIRVVFLEPPIPAHISESKFYSTAHTRVKDYITHTLNCKFIDNSDYHLDTANPEYFHDEVHLSSKGRDVYTGKVVGLLR